MDLTRLSDADLMALKAGDLTKVSDAGLMQLKGPSQEPKWADLPGNIIPSAKRFAGGIVDAVTSPIQTMQGVADVAAGALRNAAPEVVRTAIDSLDSEAGRSNAQRASGAASAVGEFYKDRYGNAAGAKKAIITDPVGVAADASTVLMGGSALARAAGMSKTAGALNAASTATNPLSVVAPALKMGANVVGKVAKPVLGLTTGAGAESVGQAFKAGATGNKDFIANMRGDVPMADVLQRLKSGVQEMGRQRSEHYRANMAAISGDKSVLSFSGIDKALAEAGNVVTFKGQIKNAKAAQAVQAMADDVQRWKGLDPAEFHTPEGLDALKQRLGGLIESIPFEEKTARLAAGKVYSAVKDEIASQAPTYAKTMKSYADASEQITEIERALSSGQKASKDAGMRKLQSLMRNNANTNYGNRLDLAKTVESASGVDLLAPLAGQAMNTWTPRSLTGQGAGIASMGAVLAGNPQYLAALPFQSPRAVGLGAYALGKGSNVRLGQAAGPGLIAGQTGVASEEQRNAIKQLLRR